MIKTKFRSAFFGKSRWRRALAFAVLIALFALLAGVVEATRDYPNVLEHINLEKSVSDSDALVLQNDLIWLHDYMPEWYAYITEAKPFTLSVDQGAGEHGIAANARCCDTFGNGIITFGEHFGDMTASDATDDETFEARRIEFLSTLIHEVTHVRDRRSGFIPESVDFTSCINGERSAYGKELEFKGDVASLKVDSASDSAELYRQAVEKHLAAETNTFNSNRWVLFCMAWQGSE